MEKDILILAIETSCDETAAALVLNGKEVLGSYIHTQIPEHTLYGGVVPEIASRNHIEKIDSVIRATLEEAGVNLCDVDAVAVTKGPGLIGALLVGLAEAKAIAFAIKKPLIGVHHIDGHISAVYLEHEVEPPFYSLVASGGHTSLVSVRDYGVYSLVAKSGDDAAGEAFDKVARAVGLGYPGGPKIEQAAKSGNPLAFKFPKPKISGSRDFSFSGLKTAVLNIINEKRMKGEDINVNDLAASFQSTVIESLLERSFEAMEEDGVKTFALCGGVAANLALKEAAREESKKRGVSFFTPSVKYCTDNAAMIGAAAFHLYKRGEFEDISLNAQATLKLPGDSL